MVRCRRPIPHKSQSDVTPPTLSRMLMHTFVEHHVFHDRSVFHTYTPHHETVTLPDGTSIDVNGYGDVTINLRANCHKESFCLTLKACWHVPGAIIDLFSIARALSFNNSVMLSDRNPRFLLLAAARKEAPSWPKYFSLVRVGMLLYLSVEFISPPPLVPVTSLVATTALISQPSSPHSSCYHSCSSSRPSSSCSLVDDGPSSYPDSYSCSHTPSPSLHDSQESYINDLSHGGDYSDDNASYGGDFEDDASDGGGAVDNSTPPPVPQTDSSPSFIPFIEDDPPPISFHPLPYSLPPLNHPDFRQVPSFAQPFNHPSSMPYPSSYPVVNSVTNTYPSWYGSGHGDFSGRGYGLSSLQYSAYSQPHGGVYGGASGYGLAPLQQSSPYFPAGSHLLSQPPYPYSFTRYPLSFNPLPYPMSRHDSFNIPIP
jgi:hypothetical protein